jgi:iron(II)-dependent oxidoreductase
MNQKVMTRHEILGQLSGLQGMVVELMQSTPEEDCYRAFHADIPPMAWLLGRCVYLESYWLREVLLEDNDKTRRVAHLFSSEVKNIDDDLIKQLPPKEHLLNWALELQEDNLILLANPNKIPQHPLLDNEHIPLRILQEYALRYEQMIAQLNQRSMEEKLTPFQVKKALQAVTPSTEFVEMHAGHYRIGAKTNPEALDNELPTQVVDLSSYRIQKHPVSNAEWLGFMQAGGYHNQEFWNEAGWQWLQQVGVESPIYWKRDIQRRWFSVALNGASDIIPHDAVSGISQHESIAYANWVSAHGDLHMGAVVQHEYQWESCIRTNTISRNQQVREWCSNEFHPYTGYIQPQNKEAQSNFEGELFVIKGSSMHSSRVFLRASYRYAAEAGHRSLFTGTRLVFPPSDMPWH